ncbi:MAG: nucleotide exchange factor GrpE, partial [Eubacteriales bacterium]|nr:nucleotide exchange factor GrpE [Eubacteriales bacterium]
MSEEKQKKHKNGPETDMPDQPGAESEEISEAPEQDEEDLQTRYLRLAADFQNFRRRSEKEKNDVYAYANEKI